MAEADTEAREAPSHAGVIAAALVGIAWVVFAAFGSVPGVFTLDDLTYLAMIDAFAHNGSLFVENGYAEFGSKSLALEVLVDSGGRLAPQYPGGWGVWAAPAYLAGGIRGVIIVNAVASALTLPLIWLAASALFQDRRLAVNAMLVYGFSTFAVDYAIGFWPHGVTTFLVAAAIAAAARAWRGPEEAEWRGFLIAGLALGIAVNIRIDGIFAGAALAAWALGAGRRPYRAAAALLAGAVPGLLAAATINMIKFGVALPVSYGSDRSGLTSFAYYADLALLAGAAVLGSLALGSSAVRAWLYRPAGLAVGAALAVAATAAVPVVGETVLRLLQGFYVIAIDFQAHPYPGRGLMLASDGSILSFGVTKKSVLESLPYLAAIPVLAPVLLRGPDRAGLALCLLCVAAVSAPFAFGMWHGGLTSNMRYLLNAVPALAILAAAALREIVSAPESRPTTAVVAAGAVGIAALIYGAGEARLPATIVQHILPLTIAIGLAVLSVGYLAARGPARIAVASAMRGVFALGLCVAFALGWVYDLRINQERRTINAVMARYTSDLPPDALVVAYVASFSGFRLNRPPALTSKADFVTQTYDSDLVARAFAQGRPVFAQSRNLAELMVRQGSAVRGVPRYGLRDDFELFEMTPPGGSAIGARSGNGGEVTR